MTPAHNSRPSPGRLYRRAGKGLKGIANREPGKAEGRRLKENEIELSEGDKKQGRQAHIMNKERRKKEGLGRKKAGRGRSK